MLFLCSLVTGKKAKPNSLFYIAQFYSLLGEEVFASELRGWRIALSLLIPLR